MRNGISLPAAVIVAVGLAFAGWFVGHGFVSAKSADRVVTVKGVAERQVEADIALWPLHFVATDNELARAQARIEGDSAKVMAFLAKNGIPEEQVEVQGLEVSDLLANAYRTGPTTSRYIISKTLVVRSNAPKTVRAASQRIGDLVTDGVVLSSDEGPSSGPTYIFTRLNDLKPAMIAEATAAARQGALKFAADSGSRLGGIRTANQGQFQILPLNEAPGLNEQNQLNKVVRVVSTIDYRLVD